MSQYLGCVWMGVSETRSDLSQGTLSLRLPPSVSVSLSLTPSLSSLPCALAIISAILLMRTTQCSHERCERNRRSRRSVHLHSLRKISYHFQTCEHHFHCLNKKKNIRGEQNMKYIYQCITAAFISMWPMTVYKSTSHFIMT